LLSSAQYSNDNSPNPTTNPTQLKHTQQQQERTGHATDETHQASERSPIFIQFLECVAHMQRQAPLAFAFNERFLVFVADHLHS
jgi:hypothetical protein